ncbi:MAG: hypothetical protein ACKN9T_06620, partial [Candidatus Methylumidiphilus sp.]
MPKQYPLRDSRFFRLSTKSKLAKLLGISQKEMLSLVASPKNYRLFVTKPKYPSSAPELRHKARHVQEPVGMLR